MDDGIHADSKLIYPDLTYQVRGAIFEIYNTLGSGHKEQVYQKALEKELEERNISYKKEKILMLITKERKLEIIDLIL